MAPPLLGRPRQFSSARRDPGAAGWPTQDRLEDPPYCSRHMPTRRLGQRRGRRVNLQNTVNRHWCLSEERFAFPCGLDHIERLPYSLAAHGLPGIFVIFCRSATIDTSGIAKNPASTHEQDQRGQSR